MSDQVFEDQERPDYIEISQNEFTYRKHKKQKDEDVAVCECTEECGDNCLNLLTSTECSPTACPRGPRCRNQRFQRGEYSPTELVRTGDGRGWGLRARDDVAAGSFIIEYCGQVISAKEARRRSHAYELRGVRDAYIISLSASESLDATRKGSLARFINHSCQPNCETRKWNVLGEVRVGIFAKRDIPAGTELSYDYNFQWFGGPKVRCLCAAPACSGFLGAKSRGFQEDTYLWEDDDERYAVEKIPLYDSAEDEPKDQLLSIVPIEEEIVHELKPEADEFFLQQETAVISRKYQTGPRSKPKKKRSKRNSSGRLKSSAQNRLDPKTVALLFQSTELQEQVLKSEEIKNDATAHLESLYDEIRPAIEEHERDNQDSVATCVAEKWIEASCMKLKAEFDLYFSIVKNITINI